MISRGKTWGINKTPVSELLQTMFINPVRMYERDDKLEPDSQPIEKRQARSAILFGPPGTSKTSLVRVLPDIIGWKYVEIHASHFVAEGLTQVQKTADIIFKQLSELDHAVVLFDEIDELVRERDMEKDAFGRFLTTSMLPKLAELWDARKILYFVATNHINYFDSAIIRSHRFDALILVSPPSLPTKIARLTELLTRDHALPEIGFQIEEQQIQEELKAIEGNREKLRNHSGASLNDDTEEIRIARWGEEKLDPNLSLAKFALLRYDELDELAFHLASVLKTQPPPPQTISTQTLKNALKKVADSEWRKNKSYADYFRDTQSERRDYQMLNIWEVRSGNRVALSEVQEGNGKKWLAKAADSPKDIQIPGFQIHPVSHGCIEILPLEKR